jgi:phage host-nuclease inhibitor protein Gam
MNTLSHPAQPVSPAIRNRRQLDVVIENIVQLRLDRAELERGQEREIMAIRQKFRPALAEIYRYLLAETAWVENWARENPAAFGEKRSLDCTHATIGFRAPPPRIEKASRKWTWSAVALKLADLSWGKRYLRIPAPEVNKEALLADRAELSPVELRQAGLRIVHEERFFIEAHGVADNADQSEADWQAAA